MRIYQDNGWKGDLYGTWKDMNELTKLIRSGLKEIAPECKFSVTRRDNAVTVALMEAPEFPFCNKETPINGESIWRSSPVSAWFEPILNKICDYLDSLNYDLGDPMRDYLDEAFYGFIQIGKWDKPFMVVKKEVIA